INQTRGVLLTGLIGVLLMSWELLKKLGLIESDVSVEAMYSGWLLGYSSLLGPIAGIMIVDYFVIKRQQLNLPDLYKTHGIYSGFNINGFIAFAIPVALTLYALMTGQLNWFYQYGWFTGSILGGITYWFCARKQTAELGKLATQGE
ncbi:cytosine permease, partial [Amphritea sp. 1_MG-2023]|uniref:cytosine permease n=1 Tax=Amphritea sp. 1_MG-2023 TaxID=3062670 RepID=UPI0026E164CE